MSAQRCLARRLLYVAGIASGRPLLVCGTQRLPNTGRCFWKRPHSAAAFFSTISTRGGADCDTSSHDALEVLSELVTRLQEPSPLRLPNNNDVKHAKNATGTSNLSLEELASLMCKEYQNLPPVSPHKTGDENKSKTTRGSILDYLAVHGGISDQLVTSAVDHYHSHTKSSLTLSPDNDALFRKHQVQLVQKLRLACTPAYETLSHCLLEENAKEGIVFLVRLREDLRRYIQKEVDDDHVIQLKQFDFYLRDLFSTWFSRGMLEMRRITYEDTSACIIEEIATKEAVHPMRSLDDLKSRLGPDRRVFAAFHPLLPNQPLVFVHIALANECPSTMEEVLTTSCKSPDHPTVATFYSISSTQSGLSGVDLGHFLIQRAVKELQNEFPSLQTFVTLSPIPRFRKWLEEKIAHNTAEVGKFVDETLLTDEDIQKIKVALRCSTSQDVPAALLQALKREEVYGDVNENERISNDVEDNIAAHEELKPILMKLASRYLVFEKHRGKPLDGVARFHVGNGAEMYRLNYMADLSRKGWHNSIGMMINYRYNLNSKEENQARYEQEYHITVCDGVSQWLPVSSST